MRGAGHARIEAANRAQDIDALEAGRILEIGFDEHRVQHRLLVSARFAPGGLRTRVHRRRRADLVVRQQAIFDHAPVGKEPPAGAPEADADETSLGRHFEWRVHPRLAALLQVKRTRPVFNSHHQIERDRVGARTIALEGVPDVRNLPLQRHRRQFAALGDIELQAVPGGFDIVARGQLLRQRRDVDPRVRSGFECVPVPRRRGGPAVALLPVLRARPRDRRLVPWMVRAERRAHRVSLELVVIPLLVIRVLDELLDAHVQVAQVGRHQLAVDDGPGRRPAMHAPLVGIGIGGVVMVFMVPLAKVDHRRRKFAAVLVVGIAGVHEVVHIVPDADAFLGVVEERRQRHVELAEGVRIDRGGDSAGNDGLRMRVLSPQKHIRFARHPRHLQRFEVQLARQRIEIGHDRADGRIAMHRGVLRGRSHRLLPHFGIGIADQRLGEIGAGQDEQVQRVVV